MTQPTLLRVGFNKQSTEQSHSITISHPKTNTRVIRSGNKSIAIRAVAQRMDCAMVPMIGSNDFMRLIIHFVDRVNIRDEIACMRLVKITGYASVRQREITVRMEGIFPFI